MGSNHSTEKGGQARKLGGLSDLRTAAKVRLRSKPKVEGQEYLNMYVLTRDRARWGRMERQSAEAVEEIEKDLKRIQKEVPAVEDTQDGDHGLQPPPKRAGKNFGTFRVDY